MTAPAALTDYARFRERARLGSVVPVQAILLADSTTPVDAAHRLWHRLRDPFLLESAEGGESVGRWSYLGGDPFVVVRGSAAGLIEYGADGSERVLDGPPVRRLGEVLARWRAPADGELPPFAGGAVGFVAYDAVRWAEAIPQAPIPATTPWLRLGIYDTLLAFDHLRHRLHVIAGARLGEAPDEAALRRAYDDACARVARLVALLQGPCAPVPAMRFPPPEVDPGAAVSSLDAAAFGARVERIREHIRQGDAFQVVLSRRLTVPCQAAPLAVYRALRAVNPSPYMYCLDAGDMAVVGASPEMLVRVQDGVVETRPIAGTRRRGVDEAEDRHLAEELLADDKERAEHLMLVDLGRNDIGRVAEYGSVEVPEFMRIERYSHVMHLVSAVRGRLRADVTPIEAMFAGFPAGTVSGAPKVRAMQLINELEGLGRGVYAGAVLYADFAGNLNSCIAIRTVLLRHGVAELQAGAGIVAGSRPQREFEETWEKAAGPLQAVAWAQAAHEGRS